jgi:hypothetical protein
MYVDFPLQAISSSIESFENLHKSAIDNYQLHIVLEYLLYAIHVYMY